MLTKLIIPLMLKALGAKMKNIFIRTNSDFVYEVEALRYLPGMEDGFVEMNGTFLPYVSTPEGNKIPDKTSFILIDEVGNKDVCSMRELSTNFRRR